MYDHGYTTGTFDTLHEGHLRQLRFMFDRCKTLTVGLTVDELAVRQKRLPVFDYEHRRSLLLAVGVDHVVEHRGDDKRTAHDKLQYDVLFIGDDYYGSEEYADLPTPVIYAPYSSTTPNTSAIVKRIQNQFRPLSCGVSGVVLHLPGGQIVKQIGLSDEEVGTTANVFQCSVPPKRNWSHVPDEVREEHPCISSINANREIVVHDHLTFDWNPVQSIKLEWERDGRHAATTIVHESEELNARYARSLPKQLYWMRMSDGGVTLDEWCDQNSSDEDYDEVARQINKILDDIFDCAVVHGDMHAENILLRRTRSDGLCVSLVDFGWCMHHSFDMNQNEHDYYIKMLNERFDREHLLGSMQYRTTRNRENMLRMRSRLLNI